MENKGHGFHNHFDVRTNGRLSGARDGSATLASGTEAAGELGYLFYLHSHPYVTELLSRLIEKSVQGLQGADTDYRLKPDGTWVTLPDGKTPEPVLYEEIFSPTRYDPQPLVRQPRPVKDLDFSTRGAYSVYNWELFFHVPVLIATHLSKNQRFEEAQRWFHYVFDPTDDSAGPTPARFWKVRPFHSTDVKLIEDILKGDPNLIDSVNAWLKAPFSPHVVARYRHSAYMLKTVMAYLDNLIAWGDSLFRQDTIESINEAMQLYVLAAGILGPRPQEVPKKNSVRPQTYHKLREQLNKRTGALVELEAELPLDASLHAGEAADVESLATLSSLANAAAYFCMPRNDMLFSYWDTVADRLFKIRNSLNLAGVFRQLPLFEPPIDPALLARAAAAGLDIGAIVSGLSQPLPLVRFQLLVQKAAEICQEVKSLGNSLLSAMEKEDNEALAILRARHERVIVGLAESIKYGQWQEAIKAREGLEKSLANAAQRYVYYERLLRKKESDISVPSLDAIDNGLLQMMKFKSSEPELARRPIEVDIAKGGAGAVGSLTGGALGASDITGGRMISSHEAEELDKLESARALQAASAALEIVGAGLGLIPQFDGKASPLGVGAGFGFGGVQLSRMLSGIASSVRIGADQLSYEASRAAKIGAYARREQEWAFQSNLAAGEITQLFKQLRAAQIREAVAEREWENHQQQIRNAEEIERFLADERTGKKTNRGLYAWMKREVKGLYAQCFQLAFDVAKKAERALQHELGSTELNFIQFGYLAGKEGLLAGEKLYFDIKRMEMAYHEMNQREYELTKHASLLQVNPVALLQLRATGRCTVFLPEEFFDMDGPGHYFRRIKSVAVSVPCVTGPYTSVNCTLSLRKSTIRKNALLLDGEYARDGAEDSRFSDHFGSIQSIVTSSGQNDSGLFETNLRDERYLPFEGAGVVSEWQLELPAQDKNDPRQFDYDTISDVIIHLRYTAREGGGLLRKGAINNLKGQIDAAQAAGSVRLFSVRHEFPSEWANFKKPFTPPARSELTINLREKHYPFWSKGKPREVKRLDLFARTDKAQIDLFDQPAAGNTVKLEKYPSLGEGWLSGKLTKSPPTAIAPPPPVGKVSYYVSDNSIEDLWLAITCGAP